MGVVVRKLVIAVMQYSVVVKGVERKLTEAGYDVMMLTEDFGRIGDLSGTTDLFILYLPNEAADKSDTEKVLKMICEEIGQNSDRVLAIGEEKDRARLYDRIPSMSEYGWISRPFEMDALSSAIEGIISGEKKAGAKKRILIVDDDPTYAKMVKEWIKDSYRVDIVTAGMQAITFLLKAQKEEQVDMILLDYEMPVVDGPQVLQMLRQETETAHIPVIFLTGIGTKEAVARVMSLKPDGYLLKSTSRDNLLKFLKDKLR